MKRNTVGCPWTTSRGTILAMCRLGRNLAPFVRIATGCVTLGIAAAVGFPLGVVVWQLARYDLIKMESGAMDPRGAALTRHAEHHGFFGALFGMGVSILYALLVVYYLSQL